MRVLVIPDVHLKPEMFAMATRFMREGIADQAVCLMDIADDFGQEYSISLYEKSYGEAIAFAKEFPSTKFCFGNHDLAYKWYRLENGGYSPMAAYTVQKKLLDLKDALPEGNLGYVHRIDNVLFSHGGLIYDFVKTYVTTGKYNDIDYVIQTINGLGKREMWSDDSPLWARPQYSKRKLYKPRKLLQVVGHTPVKTITREGNLISCDTFSTYSNGEPYGSQEFLLIDTENWEFVGI